MKILKNLVWLMSFPSHPVFKSFLKFSQLILSCFCDTNIERPFAVWKPTIYNYNDVKIPLVNLKLLPALTLSVFFTLCPTGNQENKLMKIVLILKNRWLKRFTVEKAGHYQIFKTKLLSLWEVWAKKEVHRRNGRP